MKMYVVEVFDPKTNEVVFASWGESFTHAKTMLNIATCDDEPENVYRCRETFNDIVNDDEGLEFFLTVYEYEIRFSCVDIEN